MSDKKKAETIFRTFRTIVKKIGDEEGVIDILIPMSTGSVDRHGESIDPKGWKKSLKDFKKRPILLSSHNYQALQNQIGELLDIQIVEEGLLAKPKYYINQGNPEADWGYFLATKGMAAFSVGFIPIKWIDSKDEPRRTYTEQELIEISHVTVPSNRDAIMGLQAKGIDDPIIKEIIDEVLKDYSDIKIIDEALEERLETIITEIEETDEVIRIPAKGEEGKHKGHKIRWITVSTKEGIRGIYCVDCKKIITYVFDKKKSKWTLEKAKKWMTDHGKMVGDYYEKVDWDSEVTIEEINWEEFKKSMEKDEKEDKLKEIGLFNVNELYEIVKENKELKKTLTDIELKAGAVLNTKNKANLKQAQVLIQSVLDSAGTEEEGLEEGDEKTKDTKNDDTVIIITDTKKEDPPKDEVIKEKTITIDEKVIIEAVKKAMNYTLGIVEK